MFDVRCEVPGAVYSYDWFPAARWDGGDLTGKHVLLWLEQGIGDQIMGMSMIQRLLDKVASCVLMADRRFAPICRRTFPKAEFYRVGDHVPRRLRDFDFDCQLSVTDLGRMFLPTGVDIMGTPFLQPNIGKVAELRRKYKNGDKPLVGFSWMSANDRTGFLKSIPPAQFKQLLGFSNLQYVNLQYGDNSEDLAAFRALGCDFIHDTDIDPLVSLDDSAAQIAAMDIVVSVSNSTVHFAGAMGVKTYALIPIGHGRVWYWFTDHERTPWYDSVQICRSESPGEWAEPIDKAWRGLMSDAAITISVGQ